MKTKLLLLALSFGIVFAACNQDDEDPTCLELDTTASFSVNGTAFTVTHTPVWTSSGIYQSLGFRHDITGGGQELITIIFEGDSIGTYPLASVSSAHRGTYMGPTSNNNILFTGPGETGTLTITDIDLANSCLSGTYAYTANWVQITGEFQSLRPQ
jgi:hypothetical protein